VLAYPWSKIAAERPPGVRRGAHVLLNESMTSPLFEKLSDVFRDVFDDDDLVIGVAMSAPDIDGWDSLAHVRLMLSVERAFGIKFTAWEIAKLKTVGDLVDLIGRKTNVAPHG
jgi:acyl carrier protein